MYFIDVFYDWLFGAAGSNSMLVVFLILADILLFVFFAGIVISLAYSYGAKYRASSKSVINAIKYELEPDEVEEYIQQLPYAALSAWNQFKKIKRGKPSEFLSATICVDNPMKVAWLKVFSKFLYQLAAACAVFLIGYDMGAKTSRMAALLFVVGILLGLTLMLSDKVNYNATLILHEKLTATLDVFAENTILKDLPEEAVSMYPAGYPYVPYPNGIAYPQAGVYPPGMVYPQGASVPYPQINPIPSMPIAYPQAYPQQVSAQALNPSGVGVTYEGVREGDSVPYPQVPTTSAGRTPPHNQAINTVAKPLQAVNIPPTPLKESALKKPIEPIRHRPKAPPERRTAQALGQASNVSKSSQSERVGQPISNEPRIVAAPPSNRTAKTAGRALLQTTPAPRNTRPSTPPAKALNELSTRRPPMQKKADNSSANNGVINRHVEQLTENRTDLVRRSAPNKLPASDKNDGKDSDKN